MDLSAILSHISSLPAPQPEVTSAEELSGLVERVTFFNEESGYAVLKVKAKGHRELVTVVGTAASANPGEWLCAKGGWKRDRQFGLQFRADKLSLTPPGTRDGIEKYLASGMVKGIGPVYARKLVAQFGEKIFDIIENESARLESIEGIGPMRRRRIKEAWAEQKVVREIMVFLHSHGVSTSRALRIYRCYGTEAIQTVRTDPYALARDIPGVGFKTADQIAQRLGIPQDSLIRATAGLSHVLLEASQQGNAALPEPLLLETAQKLLSVPDSILRAALVKSEQADMVTREKIGGEDLIFLPALRLAEQVVATRLAGLKAHPSTLPSIDFAKAAEWVQRRTGKTLSASQLEALQLALTEKVLVITGGPGVGKTTLIHSILQVLSAKKVRCVLCAPTGRAAKRLTEVTGVPAKTIHRLLEVQPGSGTFFRNERRPLESDLIVIDETSMVDIPLLAHLLRALPEQATAIFVGDVDQLPSVGPGTVLSDLINSAAFSVVRLKEVFRQAAESHIVTAAHEIQAGRLPAPSPKGADSDFFFIQRNEPDAIQATLLDLVKSRIPQKFGFDPIRDIQVLCPLHRGSLGVRELNVRLQEALNPVTPEQTVVEKFGWQYRVRDKVLQNQNNYDKEVFNGDIGQVTAVDPIEQQVTVRFDQREVNYDFGELDELDLAYAITIHKSQGSEFPAVVIPLATQQFLLLQRNLVYTGVTRGKKLVILVGQPKAFAMAVRNNRTRERFSGLLSRLESQ